MTRTMGARANQGLKSLSSMELHAYRIPNVVTTVTAAVKSLTLKISKKMTANTLNPKPCKNKHAYMNLPSVWQQSPKIL